MPPVNIMQNACQLLFVDFRNELADNNNMKTKSCMKYAKFVFFIFLSVFLSAAIEAEQSITATTEIVGELYDKVSINPDNQQLAGILLSIKPQLIWKSNRSILLVNLQIYGDLGGMSDDSISVVEGHFGKDDVFGITLKPDSFYRTYIGDSPFYFKVGKYTPEIPFQFGGELVTGQIEAGFQQEEVVRVYWSSIFYEWYKINPFTDVNQKTVQLLALHWSLPDSILKFNYPVLLNPGISNLGQYPSLQFQYDNGFIKNDIFTGLAFRNNDLGDSGMVFALREEITLCYGEYFKTSGLYSLLTADETVENRYAFTSVDNQTPLLGYGNHFDYIYEEVGNSFGIHTFGLKQELQMHPFLLWFEAGGYFSYRSGTGENNYIGTAVRGDIKWMDLWGENTLLEILAAAFFPGGFSRFSGIQNNNPGYQLIVKLQHSF